MQKNKHVILLSVLIVCVLVCLALPCAMAEEERDSQFPFLAETNELAVNIRLEANAKSNPVGRLERGQQLTVWAGVINASGEIWYEVELEDGTRGYVRSDLLIPAEEAAAFREANPAPQAESARQYIGNRNSKKYHIPTCRTLPAEKNRVYFSSEQEAQDQGYVHCKNCD